MSLALYFVSIFSLSLSAPLIRWSGISPELIGFWRMLGAGLILLLWWLRQNHQSLSFQFPRAQTLWIFSSSVFFFTHLWTYSYSAQNTKIAHCMILFATNPVFAALGAFFLFKQKLTWRWVWAYIFAIIGIYQLVHEGLDWNSNSSLGNWSAILSGLLYAAYVLTGKKARETVTNLTYTTWTYLAVGIMFGLTVLFRTADFTLSTEQSPWAILALIVFPTFLGHAVFSYLMKTMDINLMTCGKLIEPGISSLIAFWVFSEPLSSESYAALLFTALSVLILFFPWENFFPRFSRKKIPSKDF